MFGGPPPVVLSEVTLCAKQACSFAFTAKWSKKAVQTCKQSISAYRPRASRAAFLITVDPGFDTSLRLSSARPPGYRFFDRQIGLIHCFCLVCGCFLGDCLSAWCIPTACSIAKRPRMANCLLMSTAMIRFRFYFALLQHPVIGQVRDAVGMMPRLVALSGTAQFDTEIARSSRSWTEFAEPATNRATPHPCLPQLWGGAIV